MKFKLDFELNQSDNLINHDHQINLIGSCFSDEVHGYFDHFGFKTLGNPFGTLFHPLAIASELENTLDKNPTNYIFRRDDIYLSWTASSKIYGTSELELLNKMSELRSNLFSALSDNSVLIITFGSAYAYRHKELDLVVANCHKQPSNLFERSITDLDVLTARWSSVLNKLRSKNPKLRVIFTVSPVRHIRDGLVDNNRSKARLLELVHRLCTEANVEYFPAYEIVIDELRDYRFYGEDLVHPSREASKYVWEKFSGVYFGVETSEIVSEIETLKRLKGHKSLHPDSVIDERRRIQVDDKLESFRAKYPNIRM